MQNIPDEVPASQFKELIKYWKSDKLQNTSKRNRENRKKLKNPHTCGKRSFAMVRHSMQLERDPSNSLSPKEIFVATRKRKSGRTYKCLDEDTTSKIAEMEEIEKQQNEDDNGPVNAFASVMGPEHLGRVRLYGRGFTKTSLKGKVGSFEPSSNDISYLKKLEDKIQRLEDKMEEQKTTIRQEVVADFLEQLHRSGHDIDPKIILATLGLSREASSTHAAVQPIHRPSTSNNNEGQLSPGGAGENESSDEDLT